MSYWFRAASAAATCFCAFVAAGGLGHGGAVRAQELIPAIAVEPLPATPDVARADDDGIANVAPEAVEPAAPAKPMQTLLQTAQRPVDSAEQRCIATAVYYESKGEPVAGQLAVAKVIMNRARSGRFPRSACGVVTQPSQFSFVRGGQLPTPPECAAWRQAQNVAQMVMNDVYVGPAERAMYFHARRVSPGWNRTSLGAIGNHVFYR